MDELTIVYGVVAVFAVVLAYLTMRDLCNKDGGMKSYHSKWL